MKNIRKLLITEREKKEILSLHGKQMINEYTVKDIQNVLKYKLGYDIGSTGQKFDGVDGDFGPKTKNAIFSAITKTNVQQPVTQQPVTQQPVTQQPVTQQPVTQQPVTQQPVTQDPTIQQQPTQKNEPIEKLPIRNVGLLQNPGANQQLKPGTPFIPTNQKDQQPNDVEQGYKYPKPQYSETEGGVKPYQLVQYVLASRSLFLKLEECLNQEPLKSLGITNATYTEHKEASGGNMEELIRQESFQNSIEINGQMIKQWDIVNPNGSYFVNIHKKIGDWYITANAYDSLDSVYNNNNGDKKIRIFCCKKTGCSQPLYFDGSNCEEVKNGLKDRVLIKK